MAKKPTVAGQGNAEEVEKKVSKAAAYRDAEAQLGKSAPLEDVYQFILANFGIDMPKGQISAYRSIEKSRKGAKPGKRGRKPKSELALSMGGAASGDPLIEFVSEVRGWENKIGAEKVCEVIAALYKR